MSNRHRSNKGIESKINEQHDENKSIGTKMPDNKNGGSTNNNRTYANSDHGDGSDFVEKVLVLQGGGSLGAYECGVCNTFYEHGFKFNVFAGSSIGSINVSILTAAQNAGKDPAKTLNEFWQTISEDIPYLESPLWIQMGDPWLINSSKSSSSTSSNSSSSNFYSPADEKMRAVIASMYTAFFGTPKAFTPRWFVPWSYFNMDEMRYNTPQSSSPNSSPSFTFFPFGPSYLYDSSPLKKTLKDFIDFDVLKKDPNAGTSDSSPARLIITSTNIQTGKTVVFDNQKMDIDVEKILAGTSYPFYGIKWIKLGESYLWDGSLLSNTPLGEVLFASPSIDKEFYVVDVFPREQQYIPENMLEVWHRARDILFLDKTDKSLEMAEEKKRYVSLLKKMNSLISSEDAKIDEKTMTNLRKMHEEFQEIVYKKGAIVRNVIRVTRSERMHYLFEDADFSKHRINELIQEGKQDCKRKLKQGQEALTPEEKKQEHQIAQGNKKNFAHGAEAG